MFLSATVRQTHPFRIKSNLSLSGKKCREFSRIYALCIYVDFNIKYHAHYGETIVRTMYIMGMTYY